MKYVVMECHKAYAVLMDEEARYVHAANIHYKVGQTVEDPVLLNETPKNYIIHSVMVRTAAIAAGLILMSASVFGYYVKNLKTDSVMTIGDDVQIEMELNSYGKVIRLHSNSEIGQELLKNYKGKNKKSSVAANELLQLEIEHGLIADGDTVDLYISSDNADAYNNVKAELENKLSDLKVNINVKDPAAVPVKDAPKPVEPPKPEEPAAPPAPPVQPPADDDKPTPPKPAEKDEIDKGKDKVDAPVDPPSPPEPVKPADDPAGNETPKPPVPPAPPAGENGEKPNGRPDDGHTAEPPAPPADGGVHDVPTPPDGAVTPPPMPHKGADIQKPAPESVTAPEPPAAPEVHAAEEHDAPLIP